MRYWQRFQGEGTALGREGSSEQLLGPRPPPPTGPAFWEAVRRGKSSFPEHACKKGKCRLRPRGSPKHPRARSLASTNFPGAREGPCWPLVVLPFLPFLHLALPALQSRLCLTPDPGRQGQAGRRQGCGGMQGSPASRLGSPAPRARTRLFLQGRNHASVSGVRRSQPRTRHESLLWVPWAAQTHQPTGCLLACRQERAGDGGGEHGGGRRPNRPRRSGPHGTGRQREAGAQERARGRASSAKALGQGAAPGWAEQAGPLPGVRRAASAPLGRHPTPAGRKRGPSTP